MTSFYLVLAKYLMIVLMALYTWESFSALKKRKLSAAKGIYVRQNILIYLLHFIGFSIIYINNPADEIIIYYGIQLIYFVIVLGVFPIIYPQISRVVLANMCMLLAISFIVMTRLSYEKSIKQFAIVAITSAFSLIVPMLISSVRIWHRMTWLYAIGGLALLGVVLVLGQTSYGANLSISIGQISVQPSEFVKIMFVFFVACMLYKSNDFKHVFITTAVAAAHVLILVASKDLGSALIFFVVYVFMLYIATRKTGYLILGFGAGVAAAFVAVALFSHVRSRVETWLDPWSVIDDDGYQITQSLFAISAGKWNGTGLYEGSPTSVPVVIKDLVFSAIAEEMGTVFAILLILVCLSCFLAFIKTSAELVNRFYKLIAFGLGIAYATQVFLTIGGAMNMIPLTGVTLPLVSYGGSSILSTLIVFAIIQGLVIVESKEERGYVREKKRKAAGRGQSAVRESGRAADVSGKTQTRSNRKDAGAAKRRGSQGSGGAQTSKRTKKTK